MADKLTRDQVLELCASRDAGEIGELWLSNADLSGLDLSECDLRGARMRDANLTGANLQNDIEGILGSIQNKRQ